MHNTLGPRRPFEIPTSQARPTTGASARPVKGISAATLGGQLQRAFHQYEISAEPRPKASESATIKSSLGLTHHAFPKVSSVQAFSLL